jgi:hypothetical protein
MPAHAQRVFVSGTGVDTNPCSATQPCRSFQQAYNTVAANGEIDVLDPAGYGALTITHGITIQAHGFGGITQACNTCAAITVAVTTADPVTLNGLLIDGAGTGYVGILINSGPSVQILNSVVRHFQSGIGDVTSTNGSNLLIEDTIASDNGNGVALIPGGTSVQATLNGITANNNATGVWTAGNKTVTSIANSVLSNNGDRGLDNESGVVWLAKTVISGNATGVVVTGTVNSYGDNCIRNKMTPLSGSLTPVTTQ